MLNYIWFGLIAIAVVTGLLNGTIDAVTEAAFASARQAVDLAIGLIGAMALWLGIMRIADRAGLVAVLARGIRPVARRLFPEIPDGHPALGSIVMNMAANILGLGNAATPMGLKAMKELQELNPDDETATNAMVTFLAINTSSVQVLLPASVVGLMGARSGEIFVPVLVATTISTLVAIVAAKWLQGRPRFALQVEGSPATDGDSGEAS